MSAIEVSVIAFVVAWLGVLTLLTLVLVRQAALLTVRMDRAGPQIAPGDDGLMIGRDIPARVIEALPETRAGVVYALVLSAICAPCREIAPKLYKLGNSEPIVALVAGRRELAEPLAEMLPPSVRVIPDPLASELAGALEVRSTPFAIELEYGKITGKVFLHEAEDLGRLINARRSGARRLPIQLGSTSTSLEVLSHVE